MFLFLQSGKGQNNYVTHTQGTFPNVWQEWVGLGLGIIVGLSPRSLDSTHPPILLPPQFLLIFHKAAAGELQEDSGLMALAKLSEIDVALEGVKGAKDFFEAKVGACSFSAEPLALPSLCACDRHSVPSDCPICTRWYIMYNSRKMVWGSVHVLAEN